MEVKIIKKHEVEVNKREAALRRSQATGSDGRKKGRERERRK